nr:GntR family transcriptional regulator [Govania unica]
MQQIERNTTAAEVARVLRQRILGGLYQEGEFLRQESIAQELGVSRLPVREALALLEAEGFVIREKYRGALIPKLSIKEVREIYSLRNMVEPYLLEHALPHLTAEHLSKAKEHLAASRSCQDLSQWAELNWAFHKTLYEPANLPLAMQVLEQLLLRADRYLKMQRSLSMESLAESHAEHQSLIDLIEEGKFVEAVDALRKHIVWNEHDVAQTFDRARKG